MLIELFDALNKKYPPPKDKKHYLLFNSEQKCLVLGVWTRSDYVHSFSVEENELHNTEKLLSDIQALLDESYS